MFSTATSKGNTPKGTHCLVDVYVLEMTLINVLNNKDFILTSIVVKFLANEDVKPIDIYKYRRLQAHPADETLSRSKTF